MQILENEKNCLENELNARDASYNYSRMNNEYQTLRQNGIQSMHPSIIINEEKGHFVDTSI